MAGMEHRAPQTCQTLYEKYIFHSIYKKTDALGKVLSKIIKYKLIYEF